MISYKHIGNSISIGVTGEQWINYTQAIEKNRYIRYIRQRYSYDKFNRVYTYKR